VNKKKWLLLTAVCVVGGMAYLFKQGLSVVHHPGVIEGDVLPEHVITQRGNVQENTAAQHMLETEQQAKQILFGDLHVHTTYSTDAFFMSLPMIQGEGLHPISDACDFARYCSELDFWSINDHAVSITPAIWEKTVESIRQCNAVSENGSEPDTVAFLGWEWTQAAEVAEQHYGHKNVIFRDIEEGQIPSRPIRAVTLNNYSDFYRFYSVPAGIARWAYYDEDNRSTYGQLLSKLGEHGFYEGLGHCDPDAHVKDLPADCIESAATPAELFSKLRQWNLETMVIPHGNSWGLYTPPNTDWEKQLKSDMHDPELQSLIEVYSGHGNSEEYRNWRAMTVDENGQAQCPAPSKDYLPCCWQAGEIIRGRCDDPDSEQCDDKVAAARDNYLRFGAAGHLSISGESVEDWKDCGQCSDCFTPAFNYRPGGSTQYALALGNFDEDEQDPQRFRFGFIASSDNHSSRPGTGYKEFMRRSMTDTGGPRDDEWVDRVYNHKGEIRNNTVPDSEISASFPLFNVLNMERGGSFFLTGGLVATHAAGRGRNEIWDALKRKEVYGTSGPKILLWFDLLNGPEGDALPMGSEVRLQSNPQFKVTAAGDFKQKPGCPEYSFKGLSKQRLDQLCGGECYHPSDERLEIDRIEVVRIRPQSYKDEPVENLIEDPWRTFECPQDGSSCSVTFEDDSFTQDNREYLYYARAIQEATPVVNGAGLRCERDENGQCLELKPCYGDARTGLQDDCLAMVEQRAWASPIYVSPYASAEGQP